MADQAQPEASAGSPVLYQQDEGVATITLNQPRSLNSFTVAQHEALIEALDRAAADDTVRVVILTGAGRGFSAGQDLSEVTTRPDDGLPGLRETLELRYNPLIRRIVDFPTPVICAVNGVAAGAGANLALACDLVFAARSAKFIEPFCNLGLVPDAGGSWLLPRLVGRARALGMSLLGGPVSAEQAEEWGLIWRCVDDEELSAEVMAVARRLAQGPTAGLVATRRAIDAAATNDLPTQLDLERDLQEQCGRTHDYSEGVEAFNAKRPPRFIGR
ncbi:MAG TPA: 2-(1,2-epoxy-1,2-dihydrophenyl)acetyl-CoA isomerase [Acidimicrobiales bacterium]|nr:2-(1,2-epoxy-1,2-dihydrophenyl)acetyl-CoA isomerase [Acidimicrobiales bacterium]